MDSWFSSPLGVTYAVMLAGAALLAYAVRRRILIAIGTALVLPALPAALWLFGTDGSGLDAGETAFRSFVAVVTSYASIWLGLCAGLLQDRFAASSGKDQADPPRQPAGAGRPMEPASD